MEAVVTGGMTRESVHDWVVPWVEGKLDVGPPRDFMAAIGLQWFHGLDMTADPASPVGVCHGRGDRYLLSDEDVSARLAHWRSQCRQYDQGSRDTSQQA